MRREICGSADNFASAALISLLPVVGSISKLEELTTSLFARYEKVSSMLRDFHGQEDLVRRSTAEQSMLRAVLDWLEVQPAQAQEQGES